MSDVIWLNNRERQDIQNILGLSWVKAFDDSLSRFTRLATDFQHDLYKPMLMKFEKIKNEQTEFVRALSAKAGKRKSILVNMGLLGDTKKKDAYNQAISFISKSNKERLITNALGQIDNDLTEKFNFVGNVDSFIHLLPNQFEEREVNDLEGSVMPDGFFQGKYYATDALATSAGNRITRIVGNLVRASSHPSTEIETSIRNVYEALIGELPESEDDESSDHGEGDNADEINLGLVA
jgi:hypothetical protein